MWKSTAVLPKLTPDPMPFDDMVRLFKQGGTVWCTVCGAAFHAAPQCLPCPLASHCVRRGPHESCLCDHDRPGGVCYPDPRTGRSPLDEATLAAARRLSYAATAPTPLAAHVLEACGLDPKGIR